MQQIEIDDVELMELLDQLDNVTLRQSNTRLGLLSEFELPLQLQQLIVHRELTNRCLSSPLLCSSFLFGIMNESSQKDAVSVSRSIWAER